jgi:hypothetical protein
MTSAACHPERSEDESNDPGALPFDYATGFGFAPNDVESIIAFALHAA